MFLGKGKFYMNSISQHLIDHVLIHKNINHNTHFFSTIQTPRIGLKKEGTATCFKTNFRFSGCHRWLKHWKWFSSFSRHELLFNQWLSHKKLCFVLQTLVFQDNDFEVRNIKSEIETFILDYLHKQYIQLVTTCHFLLTVFFTLSLCVSLASEKISFCLGDWY